MVQTPPGAPSNEIPAIDIFQEVTNHDDISGNGWVRMAPLPRPVRAGNIRSTSAHSVSCRSLVAQAMPADQYSFRPPAESMDFGQLRSHIATAHSQFCAGLKDREPPSLPSPTDKDAVVKFLGACFDDCAAVIPNSTGQQLTQAHDCPHGHLPEREILLAM
jgi:hypothetical protein